MFDDVVLKMLVLVKILKLQNFQKPIIKIKLILVIKPKGSESSRKKKAEDKREQS